VGSSNKCSVDLSDVRGFLRLTVDPLALGGAGVGFLDCVDKLFDLLDGHVLFHVDNVETFDI